MYLFIPSRKKRKRIRERSNSLSFLGSIQQINFLGIWFTTSLSLLRITRTTFSAFVGIHLFHIGLCIKEFPLIPLGSVIQNFSCVHSSKFEKKDCPNDFSDSTANNIFLILQLIHPIPFYCYIPLRLNHQLFYLLKYQITYCRLHLMQYAPYR